MQKCSFTEWSEGKWNPEIREVPAISILTVAILLSWFCFSLWFQSNRVSVALWETFLSPPTDVAWKMWPTSLQTLTAILKRPRSSQPGSAKWNGLAFICTDTTGSYSSLIRYRRATAQLLNKAAFSGNGRETSNDASIIERRMRTKWIDFHLCRTYIG